MSARSVAGRAALCVVALATAIVVLWSSGGGWLTPPVRSWSGAERWYEEVGPDAATLALVRVAGLAMGLWLLAGAVLQLAAAVLRGRVLQLVADLVAPRSLQRLVHGLAGLSLSAGLAVTAPSAGILAGPGPGVAVMRPADGPPGDPGTATMRMLDDASSAPAPPAAVAATPAPAAPPAVDVVSVAAGDCFWSISAEVLADALGRPATDREVAAHWRRLVEANRGLLVDPGNPDLLYAGQQLVVPAPDV
jgi:hypothetical protein